jgi:hypothetical protein
MTRVNLSPVFPLSHRNLGAETGLRPFGALPTRAACYDSNL